MKITLKCDRCRKEIERYPSQIKKHNFCSRECLSAFSDKDLNPTGYADLKDYTKMSQHMHDLNIALNPSRMTFVIRRRVRIARMGTGLKHGYTKIYGRAAHRVEAEKMLGRPLKPGEVVHHLDGNKRNNRSENLMVFSSQAEHAAWHKTHDKKEGDAE
jgi:hypothetical protein